MKSKRLLTALLLGGGLLTAAAVPLTAVAVDGPAARHHRAHAMERMMRMADELGLSDAQRAQVKGIFESHKAEHQGLRDDTRSTLKALDEAISSGADNDTIAGLAIEAHGLKEDRQALKKEVRKEVMQVLTPEQRAELKQIRQARRAERGEGQGRRGRR